MFTHAAIKAGAISASLFWLIFRHLLLLREVQEKAHLAVSLSHITSPISACVAVPPVSLDPDPALAQSCSSLLWGIVYWSTGLIFGLCAVFIAFLVKKAIRDYRDILQRLGRPLEKARTQESLDHEDLVAWLSWLIPVATDSTYRCYQFSLVTLFLGVVNLFRPIGATVFVPAVICGLYYVFSSS
jgi:hypothetical protein